jgi:hypothetical protein
MPVIASPDGVWLVRIKSWPELNLLAVAGRPDRAAAVYEALPAMRLRTVACVIAGRTVKTNTRLRLQANDLPTVPEFGRAVPDTDLLLRRHADRLAMLQHGSLLQ